MDIDPTRPVPIYHQVKTLIMEKISSGAYLAGDRLPTEQELCAKYAISRTPVHRALAELADEGVIVRRRRHGTIVNPHWAPPPQHEGALRVLIASEEWATAVQKAAPEDLDLNVVAVGYPNLHRHITRAVAEGQAPDLMLIDSVWVREFSEGGILAPLDDLAPSWIAAEYDDFVPRFEHNRRAVAVAAEVNIAGLWYCEETFTRHGLRPPTTWDELEQACLRLRDLEPKRLPLALPLGIKAAETTTYCLVGLMATNHALVVDEPTIVLDSPATVATLAFVKSLTNRGLCAVQGVAYEWDRAPELLATGQAVMSVGGTYEAAFIAEASGLPLRDLASRFGFAPLPHGPSGSQATVLGGMAYAIPRQSQRPFDAMRLLRALVDLGALRSLARATGTVPGRRSGVVAIAEDLPVVRAAAGLIDGAVLRPQTIAYNRVSTQLQLMVESVVLGRMAPEDAVFRAADHIGAITGLAVAHGGNA